MQKRSGIIKKIFSKKAAQEFGLPTWKEIADNMTPEWAGLEPGTIYSVGYLDPLKRVIKGSELGVSPHDSYPYLHEGINFGFVRNPVSLKTLQLKEMFQFFKMAEQRSLSKGTLYKQSPSRFLRSLDFTHDSITLPHEIVRHLLYID